jgi:hypothetical protein
MTLESHLWASVTNGFVVKLPREQLRDQLILQEAESLIITPEQAVEEFRNDEEFRILERCAYVVDRGERVMPRFKFELLKGLLTRDHAREGTLEDAILEGTLVPGAMTQAAREAAQLTSLSFRTTKCWVVKNTKILGPKDVEDLRRLGNGIPFFKKAYDDREIGGSFYYGVQALRRLEHRVLTTLRQRGRNGDGGVGAQYEFRGLSKFHNLVDRLATRIFNKHYEQISEDIIAKRAAKKTQRGTGTQTKHEHDYHLRTRPITTPTAPPGTTAINAQTAYDVYVVLDDCLQSALVTYLELRRKQQDFNFEAYKTLFQDGVIHRFTGRHILDNATLSNQASYAEHIMKATKSKYQARFITTLVNEFTEAVDTGGADELLGLPEGTLGNALRAHGEYARVQPRAVHNYHVLLARVGGKPIDEVVEGERLTRRERREFEKKRRQDNTHAQRYARQLQQREDPIEVKKKEFLLPAHMRALRLGTTTLQNTQAFCNQARTAGQDFYTFQDARNLLAYAGVAELAAVVREHYAPQRTAFTLPGL